MQGSQVICLVPCARHTVAAQVKADRYHVQIGLLRQRVELGRAPKAVVRFVVGLFRRSVGLLRSNPESRNLDESIVEQCFSHSLEKILPM